MTVSDDWGEFTPPDEVREPSDCWPSFDLDFIVEEDDRDCEQCTIFPGTASEDEIVTNWITAEEGSFVNLSEIQ